MVVKSKVTSKHVGDLRVIIDILRKHKLRLNASKCSFGVGFGKFLGYMVPHRGIEVSPDKIKAIHNLQPPWNPKEVQKLTRMIPQELTIEHWSWKLGLRLRWLIVSPLWASLPYMSSLLLLYSSLGLFFRRRVRSPSLQYLLALLISLSLRVNRFKSGWQRWLRRRKRKFGTRRRKFGLSWFPRRILSGLGLY